MNSIVVLHKLVAEVILHDRLGETSQRPAPSQSDLYSLIVSRMHHPEICYDLIRVSIDDCRYANLRRCKSVVCDLELLTKSSRARHRDNKFELCATLPDFQAVYDSDLHAPCE